MSETLQQLLHDPVIAAFGLLVLLGLLLAPIALRLAGLSGSQIVELLRATLAFVLQAIQALRDGNRNPPS